MEKREQNMKSKLLLLPFALLSLSTLSGCQEKKTELHITYGTHIDAPGVKDLSYGDLMNKLVGGNEQTENFLLAIYYGKDSHCSCWGTFKVVLEEYADKYDTVVYSIDRFEFDSQRKESDGNIWKNAGLSFQEKDEPRFFIMSQGKVKKAFYYNSSKMFKNCDALNNEISNYIKGPNIFYVEQDELDNRIFAEMQETVVYYVWSFCPDCSYCSPNFLNPYANVRTLRNNILIIDIGELTGYDPTSTTPFANFNTSNPEYVAFLNEHHMSEAGDQKYGYGRGFVPTIQYWKNGELQDMAVYFNDTLAKEDDHYIVTESYYTEERLPNLKYMANVEHNVLKGTVVPAADVIGGSWDKEAAAKYHNTYLGAFLDMYAK